MGMIQKIWLTGLGIVDRIKRRELGYKITLENINISFSINQEYNQTYISMNTDNLIMLRDAINRTLVDQPKGEK